MASYFQNKRGKYDRHDNRDEEEKPKEEPAEDPLKDATTLYVGNLYGILHLFTMTKVPLNLQLPGPFIQRRNRFTSFLQNAVR
jgi:hypothetical protein